MLESGSVARVRIAGLILVQLRRIEEGGGLKIEDLGDSRTEVFTWRPAGWHTIVWRDADGGAGSEPSSVCKAAVQNCRTEQVNLIEKPNCRTKR